MLPEPAFDANRVNALCEEWPSVCSLIEPRAHIRQLRFPVASVVAMVADGMSTEEILVETP